MTGDYCPKCHSGDIGCVECAVARLGLTEHDVQMAILAAKRDGYAQCWIDQHPSAPDAFQVAHRYAKQAFPDAPLPPVGGTP